MISQTYFWEYGEIAFEMLKEGIRDYINYKKAQITEWKYYRNKFCGIVNLAGEKTLEARMVIFEFQKRKRELKSRLGKL
jgi:hypothetical protein